MRRATFGILVRLEPRLLTLLQDAVRDGMQISDQQKDDAWSDKYLPAITDLVGFAAKNTHPILNTADAYDIAYSVIRDALFGASG